MSRENSRTRRKKRRDRFGSNEDVNPMNFVSNLSDAMLVLAVGIMVALVLHWNVDLESKQQTQETEKQEQVVTFQDDDLENQEKVPDSATPTGQVFYDAESDTYYIVNENGQTTTVGD